MRKCGIYVRVLPHSGDDGAKQVQECRKAINRHGWSVSEEHVYVEEAWGEASPWDRSKWTDLYRAVQNQTIDQIYTHGLLSVSFDLENLKQFERVLCDTRSTWGVSPSQWRGRSITVSEVAALTGLSVSQVRSWSDQGKMPSPGPIFYARSWDPVDIVEWWRRGEEDTRARAVMRGKIKGK